MPLTPRRVLAAAAALVAAASLTAVAGTAVAAAPTHHARPTTATAGKAPKVGTCYAMTLKQVAPRDNRAKKIPCSRSHTAIAIAVSTAPKRIDLSDDAAFGAYTGKVCDPAYAKTVGSDRAGRLLTSYSMAVFSGTAREIKAGDRTVECDLILAGGKTLAPLPTKLKLSGKPPYNDAVRRCIDIVGSAQYRTVCARRHDLRSTKDFVLKGKAYPGASAFYAAASRRCGKKTYLTYPTQDQWNAGYKYTICFDKTHR